MIDKNIIQIDENLLKKILGEGINVQKSNLPLNNDELINLGEDLLQIFKPISIPSLFHESDKGVRDAILKLKCVTRYLSGDSKEDKKLTLKIDDLIDEEEKYHLIVALGGSGKTYTLWDFGCKLIRGGKYIPILINLADFVSTKEAIDFIEKRISTGNIKSITKHPGVVFLLDGWSQYPSNSVDPNSSEKRKLLGIIGERKIIATSRYIEKYYGYFKVWKLTELTEDTVTSIVSTAFTSYTQIPNKMKELLKIPLMLILYLLLAGKNLKKGELIYSFHNQLTETLKNSRSNFNILCRSIARIEYFNEAKQYSDLYSQLEELSSDINIEEMKEFIQRIGTLGNGIDKIQPIHDLYWEWMVGCGTLIDWKELSAYVIQLLSAREYVQLALESGTHFDSEYVKKLIDIDIVFAAMFIPYSSRKNKDEILGIFSNKINDMFKSTSLIQQVRGIYSAILSKDATLFKYSLEAISNLAAKKSYLFKLDLVFDNQVLWRYRDIIEKWLCDSQEKQYVLDAIQHSADRKWIDWIEAQYRQGRLKRTEAVKVALGCTNDLPLWVEQLLPQLITDDHGAYYLRSAAERCDNLVLARWIFEHYEKFAVTSNDSTWCHFNQVLISCGNNDLFDEICTKIPKMALKSQELLSYVVIELGEERISKLQTTLFENGLQQQHYNLYEKVYTSVTDDVARKWTKSSDEKLIAYGWSVLVKKYQNEILEELIDALPDSFTELHNVPTLEAMKYLDTPPESLINELWKRLNGNIQPRLMQIFIVVMSKIMPNGIPSIIRELRFNLNFLPLYHLNIFIKHLKEWQEKTGLLIKVNTQLGEMDFRDFLVLEKIQNNIEDPFIDELFKNVKNPLVLNYIASLYEKNSVLVLNIIKKIGKFEVYNEKVVSILLSLPNNSGIEDILKLFYKNLSAFPEKILLEIFNRIETVDEENRLMKFLIESISNNPVGSHKNFHIKLLYEIIKWPSQDFYTYKNIAKILAIYEIDIIQDAMKQYMDTYSDNVIWIIRNIEQCKSKLLINEKNQWISNMNLISNDEIQKSVDNKIYTYEHLLNCIIYACTKLQGRKMYENVSENDRNSVIADLLEAKGYNNKDQALWGKSNAGKSSGELDIFIIKEDGIPFSIIEALNLNSLDKDYINKHLNKIFKYDTIGLKCNFILVYSTAKNFSLFWKKYYEYISEYEYQYKIIKHKRIEKSEYSEMRIAITTHIRNGKQLNLYHICVNLNDNCLDKVKED